MNGMLMIKDFKFVCFSTKSLEGTKSCLHSPFLEVEACLVKAFASAINQKKRRQIENGLNKLEETLEFVRGVLTRSCS